MATQSLKHVFYPLYMDKPGSGVGEVRNKAYGVFATRLSTHRFLDIPDSKIFVGDIEREAKGGIRTFTLADGTVLSQSKENSDGKVADYVYTVKKRIGQKRVIIRTGKRIYPSDSKKTQVHTLSFAFPKWATIPVISDALGEFIPPAKIARDGTPSSTEIEPYYTIEKGGTYGIWQQTTAQSSIVAGTNVTELLNKIRADGGDIKQ
ncbi:hypothetical protein [Nostoc sp. TCL240-02]|uniref:hypothetical protein n=1 Tax=Nostoc sp. TCL240-02 TaxID=2572090 RepID=UPI00157F831D|nr:hypothetical protein [Nostoc sp. TCL240-02]QKQ76457.1 hypothetical protein FBB35_27015 [Nostoc sp. TCL240-02]